VHSRAGSGGRTPNGKELDEVETRIRRLFRTRSIGAILVEPVQARGGIHVPPLEFLGRLRGCCDDYGALLIADEIYTGFGRTGRWFACEHSGVVPDLICLGKALTGGFPLSACVGRAGVMDAAWPKSSGEAIHTSTFLGHPVGCAMALAQIEAIQQGRLVERSAKLGGMLLEALGSLNDPRSRFFTSVRGLGLMAGLDLRLANGDPATNLALWVIKELLKRGFILLPEGEHSNVVSFTPPLTITEAQLRRAVNHLAAVLQLWSPCK
jgi:4-aminobutyrate aminotransferase-like enzyme